MSAMRPVIGIVVAAGRSRRMAALAGGEAGVNKLLLEAGGRPLLAWTLAVLEACPRIARIYVTSSEEDREAYRCLVEREGFTKVAGIVKGGEERQESVYLALRHVKSTDPEADADPLVAIHDGARPLLTQERLLAVLDEAAASPGGALLGVPLKETLKRVDDRGVVLETIPRHEVMVAQTPQVFPLDLALASHERAIASGFPATDDASLVERMGLGVRMVRGDYENLKITTPDDLVALGGLLRQRAGRAGTSAPPGG